MSGMTFYQRLQRETSAEREYLLTSPLITAALQGDISKQEYMDFLAQAYHHVKHTTPLLMATGSRISDNQEWLRERIAHYIEEETGHQEWILNDIRACCGDAESVRTSTPCLPVELMISFVRDFVSCRNPLGFFGMVYVLEGTSVTVATPAADRIREALALPKSAFSYLYSHGSLDMEHIDFFADIVNRIDNPSDHADIIHVARVVFRLYADMFRTIK